MTLYSYWYMYLYVHKSRKDLHPYIYPLLGRFLEITFCCMSCLALGTAAFLDFPPMSYGHVEAYT